jgi:hypothetical protein
VKSRAKKDWAACLSSPAQCPFELPKARGRAVLRACRRPRPYVRRSPGQVKSSQYEYLASSSYGSTRALHDATSSSYGSTRALYDATSSSYGPTRATSSNRVSSKAHHVAARHSSTAHRCPEAGTGVLDPVGPCTRTTSRSGRPSFWAFGGQKQDGSSPITRPQGRMCWHVHSD